jgi:hypothetical protein
MANHTVTIYLNVQYDATGHLSGMLDGYQAGDEVTPVFTYCPWDKSDYTPVMLAEDAFRLFNAPEESITQKYDLKITLRYRANKLRSLSVGDLVMIDGEVFACEKMGFRHLGFHGPGFGGVALNVVSNPFDNF